MTFRQIIAQYSPVDCKNKLNDLLAAVERNFGVFSPDMELDIRATITKDEVASYFDRIIHEAYPQLEYDEVKKQQQKPQKPQKVKKRLKPEELTPKQKLKKSKKEAKKQAKLERAREQDKAIHEELKRKREAQQQQFGRNKVPDFALRRLVKNGRDYSKPSLESQLSRSRESNGKDKPRQWVSIVSVPMGGQNKKY